MCSWSPGNPQMTGTATLDIHVTDENDNTPTLNISIIDMCQLDGPFRTNISAFDFDEEPYVDLSGSNSSEMMRACGGLNLVIDKVKL